MERIDFQVNEEDRKDIVKRTYKFALRILYIVNKLPKNVLTYRMIDQLVGCGTSMGSNTEEASAGFMAKVISPIRCQLHQKRARETNYFLRLLRDSGLVKESSLFKEIVEAIDESNQIKKILTAVVKTSQAKTEVKKSNK